MEREAGVIVLAMGIACVIVLLGWTVAVVLAIVFMNRRVRRLEATGRRAGSELALLFYAVSACFWPGALVCTILFLREAKTAHQGRVCGIIGLAQVSLIVLLTCVGMFALAVYRPDWLP